MTASKSPNADQSPPSTPAAGSTVPPEFARAAEHDGKPAVFKPERVHLLALGILTVTTVLIVGWAPLALGWILIFPLLAFWWVLRAKVVVSEKGIDINYAFRGNKLISWDEFAGIGFKRARAFAATHDGKRHSLPSVTFNSLPRLSAASRGRIPDALTAGKEAAEDKIVLMHRDGQQVLISREEYEELAKSDNPHPQEG